MRQEIQGAKAAVLTILWAVLGAGVAFLLYSVLPILAFFAGIAVGFGLYFFLPLFGIKTDSFKRRDWAGHGITYFFSWLAFWIILLNPPFGDFTLPTVQGVSASPYTAGYIGDLPCVPPTSGTAALSMGTNNSIYVLFRATDNVGLVSLRVHVTPAAAPAFDTVPTPLTGTSQCAGHPTEAYLAGTYNVTFPYSASSYTVEITAADRSNPPVGVSFVILPS